LWLLDDQAGVFEKRALGAGGKTEFDRLGHDSGEGTDQHGDGTNPAGVVPAGMLFGDFNDAAGNAEFMHALFPCELPDKEVFTICASAGENQLETCSCNASGSILIFVSGGLFWPERQAGSEGFD
jgi:hypothetical protein